MGDVDEMGSFSSRLAARPLEWSGSLVGDLVRFQTKRGMPSPSLERRSRGPEVPSERKRTAV